MNKATALGYFKTILRALGLLSEIAVETAPIITGKEASGDLKKAAAAAKAAQGLGEIADEVADSLKK